MLASRALILGLLVACVAPPLPVSPVPPSADRFTLAASPNPSDRIRAAAELTNDPTAAAAQMLTVLHLRDVDPSVRIAAARALADRRDASFESVLETSAHSDPDPNVRAETERARQRLWPWRKLPRNAGGLSLLCPGCGQLYLRNDEGYLHLGATAALIGGAIGLLSTVDQNTVNLGGPVPSAKIPIAIDMLIAGQNLWFYSIFDAYRDARVLRDDAGYKFAITRESLGELATAPFKPRVLASPWVWGGVPVALGIGLAVSYLIDRDAFTANPSIRDIDGLNVLGHRFGRWSGFAAGEAYYASLFGSVGVGEESLFRGMIQTELEERFGTYGGLAASSAIFGAIHFLNFANDPKTGLVAVPVIAVVGSSLGLAYIHTGHRLETSVAMHFWYDFLLSTVAFAADPTHQPFVVQYGSTL